MMCPFRHALGLWDPCWQTPAAFWRTRGQGQTGLLCEQSSKGGARGQKPTYLPAAAYQLPPACSALQAPEPGGRHSARRALRGLQPQPAATWTHVPAALRWPCPRPPRGEPPRPSDQPARCCGRQADIGAGDIIANVEGVDPARRARLLELLDIDPAWRLNRVSDGQRRRVQICMGLLKPYQARCSSPVRPPVSPAAQPAGLPRLH